MVKLLIWQSKITHLASLKSNVLTNTGMFPLKQHSMVTLNFTYKLKITFKPPKQVRYYYQVQRQMGITGAKWCDFIICTFKEMVIEQIPFDASFFTDMLLKLEQFFFKYFAKHVKEQVINKCTIISTCTVTPSITSSSTE